MNKEKKGIRSKKVNRMEEREMKGKKENKRRKSKRIKERDCASYK